MHGARRTTTTLFDEVSSGRRTAIGHLIVLYEPLVESWVRGYLGPRRFAREGDDLLQTIRVTLVEKLPGLRGKSRPSLVAWLRRVVRTKVSDWERKRKAARRSPDRPVVSIVATDSPEVASATPTPTRILLAREELEQLEAAIDAVPARYQGVLRLIHEKDPTPEEIAAFTGKGLEASRKFTAKALVHLRRALRSPSVAGR